MYLGVQSARKLRIIQPSDNSRQRTLPKYDFPTRLVNATPGVNRVVSFEIQEIDNTMKVKSSKDNTVVFNRPKHFIGSSGSVWASEYMRLRYEESKLFLTNDNEEINPEASFLIQLVDKVKLYSLIGM